MQVLYRILKFSWVILFLLVSSARATSQILFTENKGQWEQQVWYRSSTNKATTWLTNDGIYYQFTRVYQNEYNYGFPDSLYPSPNPMDRVPDSAEVLMVKATFVGVSETVTSSADGQVKYVCNFFMGDSSRWRTHVPNFAEVTYHNLYPGIDLKYYGNGSSLEYDFIVRPGADLSDIQIQFEGTTSLAINTAGELLIGTKWGEFKQKRPIAAVASENGSRTVDVYYEFITDDIVGLATDVTLSDKDFLIVDPILEFSTVIPGNNHEWLQVVKTDQCGKIYVGGYSEMVRYELSTYPLGKSIPAFIYTAILHRYDISGGELEYTTYLGEQGGSVLDIILMGCEYIAVAGLTEQYGNCMVAKLATTGDSLYYYNQFGGSSLDYALSISIYDETNWYVCGRTESDDFPIKNAFQTQIGDRFSWGGDAFLMKLDIENDEVIFSTYLGGEAWDVAVTILFDQQRSKLFVFGTSESHDFPTTHSIIPQVYQDQPLCGLGNDLFVALFEPNGEFIQSTCLGGIGEDLLLGATINIDGEPILVGNTYSSNFPVTHAYPTGSASGGAYVLKLNSTLDSIQFSAIPANNYSVENYNSICYTSSVVLDDVGNAVIAGNTYPDYIDRYPVNSYVGTGPLSDAYVASINLSTGQLLFGSPLGGTEYDFAQGIAVDNQGRYVIAGWTFSDDFPTTDNSIGVPGTLDMFISIIAPCCAGQYDVDNDGQITVTDLVFLKDYVLGMGSSSLECYEESDLDGDGQVHLMDFLYLVDYLFKGGPEPAQCNW